MNQYNVNVGDTVCHVKNYGVYGKVVSIDQNLEDNTTCLVIWDDSDVVDVQWTNKLIRVEPEQYE